MFFKYLFSVPEWIHGSRAWLNSLSEFFVSASSCIITLLNKLSNQIRPHLEEAQFSLLLEPRCSQICIFLVHFMGKKKIKVW